VERRRTAAMTAVAVLNIVFGTLGILNGLLLVLVAATVTREMIRLGIFEMPVARTGFAFLTLATSILGVTAAFGILALRPWARALNLAYAVLLLMCCVLAFFLVPIITSLVTDDLSKIDTFNQVRLAIFTTIDVGIPVIYAPILFIAFSRPAWKTTFAERATPPPLP